MKYIITLLLIVFSASVLNARSIKITYKIEDEKNLFTITVIDSKYKTLRIHKILTDGNQISVAKNKDTLKELKTILDDFKKDSYIYLWNKTNVLSDVLLMLEIETQMIWSDYQVGRPDDIIVSKGAIYTYHFYKQE